MKYSGGVLRVKRGETFSFVGPIVSSDSGMPLDLQGMTVRSQIRADNRQRELIAELACEPAGHGAIRIHAGSTAGWPLGDALWDMQLIDEEGNVRTTNCIVICVEAGVTV